MNLSLKMLLLITCSFLAFHVINGYTIQYGQNGNGLSFNMTTYPGLTYLIEVFYFDGTSQSSSGYAVDTIRNYYPNAKQLCITIGDSTQCSQLSTQSCHYKDGIYYPVCVTDQTLKLSNIIIITLVIISVYLCWSIIISTIRLIFGLTLLVAKRDLVRAARDFVRNGFSTTYNTDGFSVNINKVNSKSYLQNTEPSLGSVANNQKSVTLEVPSTSDA